MTGGHPETHLSSEIPDLYATLDVSKDVNPDDLKRAYRRLALRYHPDKNPNDTLAQEKFQHISRAYSILSDPKKKKFYDENGTVDDIDMSVEDFAAVFQELIGEMLGDFGIKEVLQDMTPDELRCLPPFPFPKELFPPGTFPEGLRFSSDGLQGVPPAVEELLEQGNLDALASLFTAPPQSFAGTYAGHSESESDWEEMSAEDIGACQDKSQPGPGSSGQQRHPRGSSKSRHQGARGPSMGSMEDALLSMFMGGGDETFDLSQLGDLSSLPDEAQLLQMLEQLEGQSRSHGPSLSKPKRGSRNQRAAQSKRAAGQKPGQAAATAQRSSAAHPGQQPADAAAPNQLDHNASPAAASPTPDLPGATSTAPSHAASRSATASTPKTSTPSAPTGAWQHQPQPSLSTPAPRSPPSPPNSKRQPAPSTLPNPPPAPSAPPPTRPQIKAWIDAAKTGEASYMQPLLHRTPALLNIRGTGVGHTALHWCAARGAADSLRWLLSCGADPLALNNEASTALHAAARNGHQHCAEVLLAAGGPALLAALDEDGNTPAQAAGAGGHMLLVEWLQSQAAVHGPSAAAPPTNACSALQPNSLAAAAQQAPHLPSTPAPTNATADAAATSSCNYHPGTETPQPITNPQSSPPPSHAVHNMHLPPPASSTTPTSSPAQPSPTKLQPRAPLPPGSSLPASSAPTTHPDTQQADTPCSPSIPPTPSTPTSQEPTHPSTPPESQEHPQGKPTIPPFSNLTDPPSTTPAAAEPPPADCPRNAATTQVAEDSASSPPPASTTPSSSHPPNTAGSSHSSSQAQAPVPAPQPTTNKGQAPAPGGRTAAQKAELRRRLLAESEAADKLEDERADARRKRGSATDAAAAVGVGLQEGRQWMDAAKAGQLGEMRALLEGNIMLLSYQGQGTKYAFSGHAALHWAAAMGFLEVLHWLLSCGANPDQRNFAGSTPLHTAVNNRQVEAVRMLLLQGCAEAHVSDELGETPKDVALGNGDQQLAASIDAWGKAGALRRVEPSTWGVRPMRTMLALWGVDSSAVVEKQDLRDLCLQVLAKQPPKIQADPRMLARRSSARTALIRKQDAAAAAAAAATAAATLAAPHSTALPTSTDLDKATASAVTPSTRASPPPANAPSATASPSRDTTASAEPTATSAAQLQPDGLASNPTRTDRPATDPAPPSAPSHTGNQPGTTPATSSFPAGGTSTSSGASSGPHSTQAAGQPTAPVTTATQNQAPLVETAPVGTQPGGTAVAPSPLGDSAEAQLAEAARQRGNDAFRQGDYSRAIVQYSMAIRLLGGTGAAGAALLHSNRSAAYAAGGRWELALEDAEAAVKLRPHWAKAWCRKGAALLGLEQGGEAVKAYQHAVKVEPGSEGAREGLQHAKEMILRHQQRYQEMWGEGV